MLFGINLQIWGVACLVIAALYYIAWPRPRPGVVRPPWAAIVLRYFHALVWFSLAITCFLWSGAGPMVARPFAVLAAVLYAVFMIAFLKYGSFGR